MNTDEARQLLQCRRAGGQDDALPEMQEALAKISGFPEFAAELEQDREMDAWLGEKLRAVEPPEELREKLLSRAAPKPPLPLFRRPLFWGAGAAAAAAAVLFVYSLDDTSSVPGRESVPPQVVRKVELRSDFRNDAVTLLAGIMKGEQQLDRELPTLTAVRDHLAAAAPPTPGGLALLEKALGCKVFQWRGRQVTLVCLQAGTGSVHLFTIDAAELPDQVVGIESCKCCESWNTLLWNSRGKVQILASKDLGLEEMKGLLASR